MTMKTLSLRLFRMSMLFLSSLILLSLKGLSDRTYANPSTTQWEVFSPMEITSAKQWDILFDSLPIKTSKPSPPPYGNDIRTSKTITGKNEFANFSSVHNGIGATGYISKYPWTCLSGPDGGIAMGVPLDTPCAMRLIYNPVTNQFYAAFDLGLSPKTTKAPNTAWINLVLYSFDNKWGFRAASQDYYELFPNAFRRRIPAIKEGIWVAFSDLSTIDNLADFGIAFHELGSLNQAPFDCENNILPFDSTQTACQADYPNGNDRNKVWLYLRGLRYENKKNIYYVPSNFNPCFY